MNDDQPARSIPQLPRAHPVQTASASIRTCRHPRNKSILKELVQFSVSD